MAVADYVGVSGTLDTQTGQLEVTVQTKDGFANSIPRYYVDPETGQKYIFTGKVMFHIIVEGQTKTLGPYVAEDNQTYHATMTVQGTPSSGELEILGEYTPTSSGGPPAPTSSETQEQNQTQQ